jgi:hypothetical protein
MPLQSFRYCDDMIGLPRDLRAPIGLLLEYEMRNRMGDEILKRVDVRHAARTASGAVK